MKRWALYFDHPDGSRECREFWAETGDDCYHAIRLESRGCVAGYQCAEPAEVDPAR